MSLQCRKIPAFMLRLSGVHQGSKTAALPCLTIMEASHPSKTDYGGEKWQGAIAPGRVQSWTRWRVVP
jgi:hypothetical protein